MVADSQRLILFAIQNREEQERFQAIIDKEELPYTLIIPETVSNVEEIHSSHDIDITITDLKFQNGGFADWLALWPQPFILIFDYIDHSLIDQMVQNEISDFLIRDEASDLYLRMLPHRIRKILNYKESIERHNSHLQATERRYLDLVQSLPDIVYSLDEEGRFNFVNNSVTSIGYNPIELLGKHFSTILHPDDVERVSRERVLPGFMGRVTGIKEAPKLFDERRTGNRKTMGLEVRILPGPGITRDLNHIQGSIVSYGEVSAVGFSQTELPNEYGSVGIIRDISARKESEQLLEKSLKEKEVLLKEIHHRVKNNLQVISSLLNLQSAYFENENDYKLYLDTQMQVQSMALVHEQLYQSDNISSIDMYLYFNRLCGALFDIYQLDAMIRYEVEAKEIFLEPDFATPLALLTAELISNSLKHAFPENREGLIEVKLLARSSCNYTLIVQDNGVGMSAEKEGTGLGTKLIYSLAEQLQGEISRISGNGTGYAVTFSICTR